MTHNQIDFQNYKEVVRHNKVSETETQRHNVAAESEIYRHNVATESETNRHNVISEQQNAQQIAVNNAAQVEQARHNKVQEREEQRHNKQQEAIGFQNASANQVQAAASRMQAISSAVQSSAAVSNAQTNARNASINAINAATSRMSQQETKRDNLVRNKLDLARVANERRATDSTIRTQQSQQFSNYVNSVTGGYRNIMQGNASFINSISNVLDTFSMGFKLLGGK